MRDTECLLDREMSTDLNTPDVDDLPLPVAADWDELAARAAKGAEVIDRHLDFESRLQGRELRPVTLCPEQKVSLISDLTAV